MSTLSSEPTKRATTQQKRAKHAWETVRQAKDWEDFDRLARRLGPRIITAGLGPAIAFTAAKEGEALVAALSDWVLRRGDVMAPKEDLQQSIRDGSSDQLRQWTAEALEWIVWVKRFCEADERSKSKDQIVGLSV
jgi:CRISPR/Cas system CMR-associated protein Cmr5 small subunit